MQSVVMKHPEHTTRYVTITEDEYDSMRSTIETLSDNELMESICRGREDIDSGRTKPLNEYLKERGVI